MVVTSVGTSGASSSEHAKTAAPQRPAAPAASSAPAAAVTNPAGAAKSGAPAPTTHANRVGVAAYMSIMNPLPAISVRTEA